MTWIVNGNVALLSSSVPNDDPTHNIEWNETDSVVFSPNVVNIPVVGEKRSRNSEEQVDIDKDGDSVIRVSEATVVNDENQPNPAKKQKTVCQLFSVSSKKCSTQIFCCF